MKSKQLTEQEKARLKELVQLKKSKGLSESERTELESLNAKCGFKPRGHKSNPAFKPGNDFAWWSKEQVLLKDAANYKCNYVAGDNIDPDKFPFTVPGVLRVMYTPTYGVSSKARDPLNVWARDLYLRMFQKYRIANSYDAPDLGVTIIAAIELFRLVAEYERIYGIINRYSVLNVNMPFAETQALGLTDSLADALRGRLPDFRSDLNELIARAQRIICPKDITLIQNALSLSGYEYLDHDSKRSQIIMFLTTAYGIYDEEDLAAGNVKFETIDQEDRGRAFFDLTADNMCTLLCEAVDALTESSSVQHIMADLVTWFGEDAMIHLLPVPEDYMVVPSYSESILHKLHNSECIFGEDNEGGSALISAYPDDISDADKAVVSTGYRIYQVGNRMVSAFSCCHGGTTRPYKVAGTGLNFVLGTSNNCNGWFSNHLLDTYREDVTEETVTEGVLWKNTLKHVKAIVEGTSYYGFVSVTTAFEVIRSFTLFSPDGAVSGTGINMFDDANDARYFAGDMAVIDWAPLSYTSDGANPDVITYVGGDIDNIVIINTNGLVKLHKAIIYSGLKTEVPVVNK